MGDKISFQLFSLYLPKNVHKKIMRLAKKERMSMTNYILKLLEKQLESATEK